MKTKIKVFVKKIKNWLSSLSKWAKKRIVPLLLLLMLVLSMCLTCFTRNKETASADTLSSDSALIVLPTIPLQLGQYDNCSFPSLYLANSNGHWFVYYAGSNDGVTGYISYYYIDHNNSFDRFTPHVVYSDITSNIVYANANVGEGCTATISALSYTSVLQGGQTVGIQYFNSQGNVTGNLIYYIYDIDGNVLLSLTIGNLLPISGASNTIKRYASFTTVSASASSDELLAMGWNNGYFDGYVSGFENGYNQALRDNELDNTPLGIIASNVNALMQINIFGNVSISDLLSIAFGCIMLGLVIKIFLGG